MPASRRQFVGQLSALAVLAATRQTSAGELAGKLVEEKVHAPAKLSDTSTLARYVDPLPRPATARPVAMRAGPADPHTKIPYYRITMQEFQAKVHRDLPPTTFWGYDGCCPGPTFDVRSEKPVQVEWVNELPRQHMLPIDHTLCGAEADKPEVRTVVHLHGGRTRPESDGYPERWFVPGQSAICTYPNQQEAANFFYHDHAMGITRLNVAAGLTGLYIFGDSLEDTLNLPSGAYEIPLVLFDRSFHPDGQLYYPTSGKPGTPWVSEYYGSAILANGKIFPYLDVEPRLYRFRVANSSNGSFYRLSISADGSIGSEGISIDQIGSEQGFLAAPANLKVLILGPGERADLLVDFSEYAGRQLMLRTSVAAVMQFRVSSEKAVAPATIAALRPVPRIPEAAAIVTRQLTIADYQNRLGMSSVMLLNGAHWNMPVTEKPVLGSTEIWSFVNLTDDSHPIHLHMVRFQMLDRRPFDLTVFQLTGKVVYTAAAIPLKANEMGWKDTVRVDPMNVTRIIVTFEGFAGRYVWHCHMLEHEDNEMMRPYEIVAS